jgi:hypothetical protein
MVALLGRSRRVDGKCRERGEDAVIGTSGGTRGRKEWTATEVWGIWAGMSKKRSCRSQL